MSSTEARPVFSRACEHQLEDLRLDGDVERGGRLVGDEEVGLHRQRHRDHHALAHAARELVRVAAQPAARVGNADPLEHRHREIVGRLARELGAMGVDRFPQLRADGEHRIERGHRLLEDHRDAVAADAAHLGQRQREQVPAAKEDASAGDGAGRARDQPQDRERGHRLAAARLADQSEHLVAVDLERDAVDRLRHLALDVEVGVEVLHPQQRLARRARLVRGSVGHRSSA